MAEQAFAEDDALSETDDELELDDDDDLNVTDNVVDDDDIIEEDATEDDDEADEDDDEAVTSEDEEDEEEETEESLDVLIAREQELDDDFGDVGPRGVVSERTTPMGEGEFTCRSCFLVKRRAQLAEEEELICFDCA